MASPNDPGLVAKALAKAQSVEARLNDLITNQGTPTVAYSEQQTIVTTSAAGLYTWTCPLGVTAIQVECWGAGGGGDGGSATIGGGGGGGGAYSAEPAYPVTPGVTYRYVVGNGGGGGVPTTAGSDGGMTCFDLGSNGVIANGGKSFDGANLGGSGGAATAGQSVSFAGGHGGGDGTQSTGGCGGGSSASPSGAGGNGAQSTTSTGVSGAAGGTDQGAGGNGGNSGASGTAGGSPGGGGGGSGTSSPSGKVSLAYNPTGSATFCGSDAIGGNANVKRAIGTTMYQSGTTSGSGRYNGTQKSVMLLPSSVASDLSGVTIDTCTLRLFNNDAWYNSGLILNLGYGNFASLASTYNGTGITSVLPYAVPQGGFTTENLTDTGLPAALKSGAAKALVFGLAPSYAADYYGNFTGAGQSNPPVLFVAGHTGAALAQGGNGSDGQVRITYSTPSTVVAAMQAVPVTDDAGNAMAAGFTGQVTAVQPGSSPSVLETWHTATLQNSWTASGGTPLLYRLGSNNRVYFLGRLIAGASVTATGAATVLATLPLGYRPGRTEAVTGTVGHNSSSPFATFLPVMTLDTSGNINIYSSYNSGQTLEINTSVPTDTT